MAVGFGATIDSRSMRNTLVNLNRLTDKVAGRTLRGIVASAFQIKNQSVRLTPIEYGNLRGSAFVVWSDRHMHGVRPDGVKKTPFVPRGETGKVNKAQLSSDHTLVVDGFESELNRSVFPGVVVGHTARYAIFVHENEEAYHEQGTAKFLEKAWRMFKHGVLGTIAAEARGLAFDTRQLFRKRFRPDGSPK